MPRIEQSECGAANEDATEAQAESCVTTSPTPSTTKITRTRIMLKRASSAERMPPPSESATAALFEAKRSRLGEARVHIVSVM